jgi:hypothetical protein
MELGQYQTQIFISLVVLLCTAFTTLICTLLKAKNKQLRKLALELQVRREEANRRPQILASCALLEAAPVLPEKVTAVPAPVEVLGEAETAQPAPGSSGRSRDWAQLLSVRRPALPRAKKRSNRASASSAEFALPAGFQDGRVLSRLAESRQPVTGLVVSIGASFSQSDSQGRKPGTSANVHGMIQSLLGPHDFAAQSGHDEFLLIYPDGRGAEAQRKLSQIAEQLWEFQLRSLGPRAIQFSWGGVEVRGESIDEAIASATDRMQETRRGRKILSTV